MQRDRAVLHMDHCVEYIRQVRGSEVQARDDDRPSLADDSPAGDHVFWRFDARESIDELRLVSRAIRLGRAAYLHRLSGSEEEGDGQPLHRLHSRPDRRSGESSIRGGKVWRAWIDQDCPPARPSQQRAHPGQAAHADTFGATVTSRVSVGP